MSLVTPVNMKSLESPFGEHSSNLCILTVPNSKLRVSYPLKPQLHPHYHLQIISSYTATGAAALMSPFGHEPTSHLSTELL
jgi:hypothetical protein